MKGLLEFLSSGNFDVPSIKLDGKMQRFDRTGKKSGWFIGWQHYLSKTGSPFVIAECGDWKTGEQYEYKTQTTYSREDKAFIENKLHDAKIKAENERALVHQEVSIECEKKWGTLRTTAFASGYLERKKVNSLYGCRISVEDNFAIAVPCRDVDGKLWGIQNIHLDGTKMFTAGQKIKGCFHLIPEGAELEKEEIVYIAEGFATAASIHQATGKPAVVSFNAGNLENVGRSIRERYQEISIVVAADDDAFTTRPDGSSWNPGREKAEYASKSLCSSVIFPKFRNLDSKPTDFNDLHCLEGIEEVKKQITGIEPEKSFIVALGYQNENYYYISNINRQIQMLGAGSHNQNGLCRLQPKRYWETLYPGAKGGVRWADAASDMLENCHKRGVFRPEMLRGAGVWVDQGKIVYHQGDRLFFDNKEHDLHRNTLRSRHIYDLEQAIKINMNVQPLSVEECEHLLNVCALFKWKKSESSRFLSGWLVTAPACGALPWRPHAWLTGPSGVGKSYVMQHLAYNLLSAFAFSFQGQTTEAGIRQKSKAAARPVIFDEFETNDERSGDRVKTILELARQASSDSDAYVAKGSVSGQAMEFRPRFSMLVSSVRVNLIHEEDKNRFCILELERPRENKVEDFAILERHLKKITTEYGHRLFVRTLKMMPKILESQKVLQGVLGERINMRFGQQYGTLLAGNWSLCSDEVITKKEAESLCDTLNFEATKAEADEEDEMNCLKHLLETGRYFVIGGSRCEKSILELLVEAKAGNNVVGDELERHGVRLMGSQLAIARGFVRVRDMYKGTKWAGGYADALSRIQGASASKTVRFPLLERDVMRCVMIPLSKIFS